MLASASAIVRSASRAHTSTDTRGGSDCGARDATPPISAAVARGLSGFFAVSGMFAIQRRARGFAVVRLRRQADAADQETSGAEMKHTLAICIPSYRRPTGLFALLGALDALRFETPPPEIRVIVVDNDPDGSAQRVAEASRDRIRFPIQYTHEHRVGIPYARNAAIAAAQGCDWVAFIDDDERPAPDWLEELLRVQRATGADVVTGPSLPRFTAAPPSWVVESRAFEPVRHATGTRLSTAFTNNLLARVEMLRSLGRLFDERFRLGVGEDDELFRRVVAAGGSILWADDAIVYEEVPPARATLRWILARGFRVGAASALSRRSGTAGLVANAAWCLVRGLGEAAWGAPRGLAGSVSGLRLAAYALGRAAGACGVH
jgi:cellulose synthase/poly-beta-1,6-N-acetylglucosamine synthase-like glycosyltransferase